jgi:hypothetical protein
MAQSRHEKSLQVAEVAQPKLWPLIPTPDRTPSGSVVRIRSGIGLRLGANLGYLKFTEAPTWNPF